MITLNEWTLHISRPCLLREIDGLTLNAISYLSSLSAAAGDRQRRAVFFQDVEHFLMRTCGYSRGKSECDRSLRPDNPTCGSEQNVQGAFHAIPCASCVAVVPS